MNRRYLCLAVLGALTAPVLAQPAPPAEPMPADPGGPPPGEAAPMPPAPGTGGEVGSPAMQAPQVVAIVEPPAKPLPMVALTVSPFHLLAAIVEVAAEVRVMPKLGVSGILGGGAMRVEGLAERVNVVELGVSPRYYLIGSFRHGMQIGAELLYVHAITDETGIEVEAAGLAVSPYLGYKWTQGAGFTLEAQLGVSYMALEGEGGGMTTTKQAYGPLLNLNAGWSF